MHAPPEHTGVAPEHWTHPAAEDPVPQCAASVAEHPRHAPPEQYFPCPHWPSEAHTHAPAEQTGVAPEHAAHPAAEDAVPQCAASVAEHATHSPGSAQ